LSKRDNIVIALGGGTVANENNLEYIKQNGKLIYLKISPGKIYQRLKYKTDRPILQDNEGKPLVREKMIGKIQYLLKMREPFYNKADVIYNVDYVNIGRSIDELIKIIYRKF
jgi:shikimate kinase